MPDLLRKLGLSSLSAFGLMLGTLFFAASLTPSLVPRAPLTQGVLGGLCLAAGYGIGVLLRAGWLALHLPVPTGTLRARLDHVAVIGCMAVAGLALAAAALWQNRLRALMQMEPIDSAGPFTIAGTALAVFLVTLLVVRLIRFTRRKMTRGLVRVLPGPQAVVLAVIATAYLFWTIGNGVLVAGAIRALDRIYAELDSVYEEGSPQPTDPLKTAGPGSLLTWENLGRAGRAAIAAQPDAEQIAAMTGGPAMEPLRVYVGLNAAEEPAARARLALSELIRIGAFDRGTLVITTPTGTGWVDPESQSALEYLLRGDVATVSVQYSYLASWVALLVAPEYGAETARAVFSAVYGHWTTLPPDARPRLYLHGLSLGAFHSDLSHDLHQVIADPYDGALWAGPPFNARTWRSATAARDEGSPAWLPLVRGGEVVRFTAQDNNLRAGTKPWGPYRVAFLQYASDAVTFYEPASLWRRPAWMEAPTGPDVSPDLVWIPVVTFLQLTFDLMLAVAPPIGYGHVYHFDHYLDAWAALTDASDWSDDDLAALKSRVAQQRN